MKIVLAPDSFKGSLTALQACEAMERGVLQVHPDAEVVSVPLADGGEGTVDALVQARGGRYEKIRVHGPLGEPVEATYGIVGEEPEMAAVIEMAACSGLTLVPIGRRNPLNTTTYGLGEMILAALETGCRRVLLGIGGSATNEMGLGMAQALGGRFFNASDREIEALLTGRLIGAVERADLSHLQKVVSRAGFVAVCDVKNPLLGPEGATSTYGPQKGAVGEQLVELERNLTRVVGLIEQVTGLSLRDMPGAGAAGGMGAGAVAFLNAQLQRGVEIVIRESRLAEKLSGASLVLSGEGRLDRTTLSGKTLCGIGELTLQHDMPLVVLTGGVDGKITPKQLESIGVSEAHSIAPAGTDIQTSMRQAAEFLEEKTVEVMQHLQR